MLLGTAVVLSFAGAFAGCSLEEILSSIELERLAEPRDLGPPQRVFAKRFVTPIRDAPSSEGARIGYLRAGALLHSTATEPIGHDGCEDGWYELDTGGYACGGRDILVFSTERLPELRARQPDREAAMPYDYVTVRRKTPLYKRLPNTDEVYTIPEEAPDAGVAPSEQPERIDNPLVLRVLQPGFYVSLDRTFEKDGETYWRTQQNGFVLASRTRQKEWSEFHGQPLDGQRWDLPMAVTRSEETTVYRVSEREKLRATRERLERRAWAVVRSRRRIGESTYLVVGDGRLVREADVLVIQPSTPPAEVGEGERWIDVDLTHQVLVAYEWKQPRYVTLVSTGRTKTPSPELDYGTPRGLHRIRAKHLTSTMDNDEPGEPPYSLEDVPYVMYFKGAYAFHSAFWHDRFGRPRSHGCINLAPNDAKWLYNWAGPDLPDTWHGGSATEENPGTWVYVHGATWPGPP
ncbi:MAG: L,D-transpeptidase [Deltaproteobacteria bacterium]|nr:L,D-transpeptidase [Deltaproteobacteria bacterium]MBW2685642.1 L,D-transpeptidase [Deltaproteobacteria bacterium]